MPRELATPDSLSAVLDAEGSVGPHNRTKDHQCLRPSNQLRGPKAVNNTFEVLDVAHPKPRKCIWVTCDGEQRVDLRYLGGDTLDDIDSGAAHKPKFDEGFERLPRAGMIKDRRVTPNDTVAFEAVHPALDRGR